MIKKLFEKHETPMCIALIVLYVVINSYCMQDFGTTSIVCALINTAFSVMLIALTIHLGRVSFYGLQKVHNAKKYLYFIPLALIASVNLWGGIHVNNTPIEILIHILTMVNVGFIEEMIFRGYLYRMMEKDNPKAAAIVSAVTFGIGHIVNLLNGEELVPTLLQLCYAVALGWLFVVIFRKSRSLWPCIIAHGVLNALSIFCTDSDLLTYVGSAVLVVVALGYAFYIDKAPTEPMSENAA